MSSPAVATGPFSGDGPHVWTYHNDNARTGRNLRETELTPDKVNKDHFGKLSFSLKVDGDVYAQPLYLSGLMIGGKPKNVVFVATQHDSVYAFDGDDGTQLWMKNFASGLGVSPLHPNDVRCGDISPEIGITGTPVIRVDPTDPLKNTLYFVAKTKTTPTSGPATYQQMLHALDVVTGDERPHSPKLIEAKVKGTGTGLQTPGSTLTVIDHDPAGEVVFNPVTQNQRAGLVLSKNIVYVFWATHCDRNPYHGWVMGFDADSLDQVAVFNTTPNGIQAGIWQGAAAPAVDADGNLFFSTGNGTFDQTSDAAGLPNQGNYGDSVLRLSPDPTSTEAAPNGNGWGLKVVDYFTPYNQAKLATGDNDLGSGGVILLDDQTTGPPHLLAIVGKQGVIYLIDRDKMGRFNPAVPGKDNVVQRLPANTADGSPVASLVGDVFGMPASLGPNFYIVGAPHRNADGSPIGGDSGPTPMRQFVLSAGKFNATPVLSTAQFAWKSSTPAVSASGTTGGIVWIVQADGYLPMNPAILHALDASNIARELYNTEQVVNSDGSIRDQPGSGIKVVPRTGTEPGTAIKFSVPTVANGKVYLGTKREVTVYGILPQGAKSSMSIASFKDVQDLLNKFVADNGVTIGGSPHLDFWNNYQGHPTTYSDFTTGNVPGVPDPSNPAKGLPILKVGDSKNSNLILALKGAGPIFGATGPIGPMPPFPPPALPDAQIDALAAWIDAGCPNAATATATATAPTPAES